jgi:hypothetical protein
LDRRAEITGGRTKLHNEEHRDLYPASNIIEPVVNKSYRMGQMGYGVCTELRNAHEKCIRERVESRSLGTTRCMCEHNIKMLVSLTGVFHLNWITIQQLAVVNRIVILGFP